MESEAETVGKRYARWEESLTSLFLRFYAKSLTRPWIDDPSEACSEATYRLSILLAAPVVVVDSMAVAVCRALFPTVFSRLVTFLTFAAGFIVVELIAQSALSDRFSAYASRPDAAKQFDKPRSTGEIAFEICCWASTALYIRILLLALS